MFTTKIFIVRSHYLGILIVLWKYMLIKRKIVVCSQRARFVQKRFILNLGLFTWVKKERNKPIRNHAIK